MKHQPTDEARRRVCCGGALWRRRHFVPLAFAWSTWAVLGLGIACGDAQLDSLGESRIHPQLIDDLEDGDSEIPEAYGRSGGWYIFNDGSGEQSPDPPLPRKSMDSPDGHYAAYTGGDGFEIWGAGLGVSVAGDDLAVGYDASGFAGIRFFAKGDIEGESKRLRVNFPSTQTGTKTTCENLDCNNHFGQSIQLTPDWQQHEILFEELSQGVRLSEKREFQTRIFRDIQFLIPRLRSFELWIDHIEFIN